MARGEFTQPRANIFENPCSNVFKKDEIKTSFSYTFAFYFATHKTTAFIAGAQALCSHADKPGRATRF